jgi:hypothetical protein
VGIPRWSISPEEWRDQPLPFLLGRIPGTYWRDDSKQFWPWKYGVRAYSQTASQIYKGEVIHRPQFLFSSSASNTLFQAFILQSSLLSKLYSEFSLVQIQIHTMQFTLSAVVLGLAATVAALPPPSAGGLGNANGVANKGNTNVKFPVPDNMTVKQAQAKCGDQAQLSCCNKAVYAGDTTDINSGMLGGTLSNLIGSGSGASGLGLFDQCSKLDLQIPILIAVPIQDLINQKCKQNIACCQNSPSSAVSTPPVQPSTYQLTHLRTPTWLALASPALLLVPSSKRFPLLSRIMQEALVTMSALGGLLPLGST